MTDIVEKARAHYGAPDVTARIRAALGQIAPEHQRLTIADIAPLDQFHTRGMLATRDLAAMADIRPDTRVLDLGCGIGGPARFLAATYGCHVTGIDLSEGFIEAAQYLTSRCGMEDLVSFRLGNALALPFPASGFDLVFLQHVAMNIQDRAGLYAEIARVLRPGGRLAMYDVVLKDGAVLYPTPWARDASASFLLTEEETREALGAAGFARVAWREDSALARDWLAALGAAGPPAGPSLAVVMGEDFRTMTGNLGRNIIEGRLGIVSAIMER